MEKLPYYHLFAGTSHEPGGRARREDQGAGAGPDGAGLLPVERVRGERHPGQVRLVLQQRARPAGEEEDHQPGQGLPRRHHRRGLADRAAQQPPRLRPAGRRASATPRRRTSGRAPRPARARRAFAAPPRRRARGADRGRGPGHRRRLHRRAGDGRRRRHRAARGLLPGDRRGLPQARRADDLRRGDLRLRPHRRVVRRPDARLSAPNVAVDGQAADRRLPAALGRGDRRRTWPR